MDKTEAIVGQLVGTYRPKAIALVGSRATGSATRFSDWDMVMLVDRPVDGPTRQIIADEFVDVEFKNLPLAPDFIFRSFVGPHEFVKPLYDPEGLLPPLIERTRDVYQTGPDPLSGQETALRRLRLQKAVLRLSETRNLPEVFMFMLSEIYWDMIVRFWFELRNEWPKKGPSGFAYIHAQDPAYYNRLQTLASNTALQTKYEACEWIYSRLFEKTAPEAL